MARLAPIALLAFAVTLACGRPAAPTATPASPAATSTPRAAATAPAPATATAAPTSAPRPAQPTPSAPGAASPTTDQATNRVFQGYQSAWEKVDRFRVEIEYSQNAQTIGLYRLLVVRPDRMHLIVLDPGTGATLMEIIQIGNKSWNKIGDRWIESAAGGNTPVDTSQLWDPGKLSPDAAAPGTITYEQLPPRDTRRRSLRPLEDDRRGPGHGQKRDDHVDRPERPAPATGDQRGTGWTAPGIPLQL